MTRTKLPGYSSHLTYVVHILGLSIFQWLLWPFWMWFLHMLMNSLWKAQLEKPHLEWVMMSWDRRLLFVVIPLPTCPSPEWDSRPLAWPTAHRLKVPLLPLTSLHLQTSQYLPFTYSASSLLSQELWWTHSQGCLGKSHHNRTPWQHGQHPATRLFMVFLRWYHLLAL